MSSCSESWEARLLVEPQNGMLATCLQPRQRLPMEARALVKPHGFYEMPKIASMKACCSALGSFWSPGWTCAFISIGSYRSFRTSRRAERESQCYALVPLTKSEPPASAAVQEHRRKVDDILRDSWRDIDGFDSGDAELDGDTDGGFNPTTYGELTPSGARHLARAIGLDTEPLGSKALFFVGLFCCGLMVDLVFWQKVRALCLYGPRQWRWEVGSSGEAFFLYEC